MMRGRPWLAPLLLVAAIGAAQAAEEGKALYEKYCAQCHGVAGDGLGIAANRVKPAPRDLTSGKYKFRSTPSGMLPTDADLTRAIRQGLPYTSMPAWPSLSDREVQELVAYIKAFSTSFADESKRAEPIEIPEPPATTSDSVEKGRAVYESQGCEACHGEQGRGDGTSAPTLKDDWGHHIRPADLTMRWTFRGGPTRKDIFRTFSTGLNGTPMPSYFDSLEVADRWHLVNYIVSLGAGDVAAYDDLLRVSYLDDEIDLARGVELFESAPTALFPLVGQIVEPGRNFYPSATSVRVQAIYNGREIAFLVRWNDMLAETAGHNAPELVVPDWDEDNPIPLSTEKEEGGGLWGDEEAGEGEDVWGDAAASGGEEDAGVWGDEGASAKPAGGAEFSDALALQLPSVLPAGIRKPYFIFGDEQNSVDLWFVDLARKDRVVQYTGRGSANLTPNPTDDFEIVSGYDHGEWHVIYKRALRSKSGVSFQEDQYVPVAFSVWDGFNHERGNKRALSTWLYLYVEPKQRVSPVLPMTRAALGTLGAELLLIFFIRRRFAGQRSGPPDEAAKGAVPHGGLAR